MITSDLLRRSEILLFSLVAKKQLILLQYSIEQYEKFLSLWKDADLSIAEVEDAKQRLVDELFVYSLSRAKGKQNTRFYCPGYEIN